MQLCHRLIPIMYCVACACEELVLFCLQTSLICFLSHTFDGHLVSMRVLA